MQGQRETDSQTRQKDIQTERGRDRLTNRETERHTHRDGQPTENT